MRCSGGPESGDLIPNLVVLGLILDLVLGLIPDLVLGLILDFVLGLGD